MKRSLFLFFVIFMVLFLCSSSYATAIYQLDDGTHENSVGLTSGGELFWANQFDVVGSDNIIESISIAWGAYTEGLAGYVYLWEDPNDDGNPTDRVLLTSLSVVAVNADTDILNTYDIVDQIVSGSFFVGASMIHNSGQYPASIDENASMGKSWIWASGVDEAIIDSFGLPGNWMIRANTSGPVVPEPNTLILFGAGLLGFAGATRRKLKK